MNHSAAGYGVYFMILERLREEKNYMSVNDYDMIAFDLRVDAELVKSVVEQFELFEFTEDGKHFYSKSFLERMNAKDEVSRKRSEAAKIGVAKRLSSTNAQSIYINSSANAEQMLNNSTDCLKERKERKEAKEIIEIKESKEKQSKVNNAPAPTHEENFIDKFFSNEASIEQFLMSQGMKPTDKEALRKTANDIMGEWKLTEQEHFSYNDFARHLISTLRIRLSADGSADKRQKEEAAKAAIDERERQSMERERRYEEMRRNAVSREEAMKSPEYQRAMREFATN